MINISECGRKAAFFFSALLYLSFLAFFNILIRVKIYKEFSIMYCKKVLKML